jgi:hypothetical protein
MGNHNLVLSLTLEGNKTNKWMPHPKKKKNNTEMTENVSLIIPHRFCWGFNIFGDVGKLDTDNYWWFFHWIKPGTVNALIQHFQWGKCGQQCRIKAPDHLQTKVHFWPAVLLLQPLFVSNVSRSNQWRWPKLIFSHYLNQGGIYLPSNSVVCYCFWETSTKFVVIQTLLQRFGSQLHPEWCLLLEKALFG